MKYNNKLLMSWKIMGINAYVPIAVFILLILYGYFKHGAILFIVPALEACLPIFGSWWSIFLLKDLLEEEGGELILSFPVHRWRIGVFYSVVYCLFFLIFCMIALSIIDCFYEESLLFPLLFQLGAESIFFSAFGFVVMIYIRNTGWSIVVVAIYSSTHILTHGKLLPIFNIYYFNQMPIPVQEQSKHLVICLFFAILLWIIGQLRLNKIERFE